MLPLAAVAALAVASSPGASRLAVVDFTANGASAQLAPAVTGAVANEIQRLGVFEVTTPEAVKQLMALERQRQLLGCDDASCFSAALTGLDFEYLVSGKVSRIEGSGGMPTTFTLEVSLLDTKTGKREGSDLQTAASEPELVARIPKAVARTMAKLMSRRSGGLWLSTTEAGAQVRIDDALIGTTPLPGTVSLPGGPHLLEVEKRGFVLFRKEVRIEPNGIVEEKVILVPSPDHAAEQLAKAKAMRLGAWIATGAAVAGAGGLVGLQLHASALYGEESQEGSFLYNRARVLAGDSGADYYALAQQQRAQIELDQTLSYVAGGVGAAAGIGAVYLWLTGEDPARYERFQPVLQVSPVNGGASVALQGSF